MYTHVILRPASVTFPPAFGSFRQILAFDVTAYVDGVGDLWRTLIGDRRWWRLLGDGGDWRLRRDRRMVGVLPVLDAARVACPGSASAALEQIAVAPATLQQNH
jgi:hypothetical protein